MKKTLLVSALMLALSSMAFAHEFEGQVGTVGEGQYAGDKIIGGWKADSKGVFNDVVENFNSSIVIDSSSDYDDIVGGNYSKTTKKDSVTRVGTTSVVIKNANAKETVIGGSRFSEGQGSIVTNKTSLEIQGGTIGVKPHNGQILEGLVFAGDQVKLNNGANESTPDGKSEINEANLIISGGTFNSLVFGGSCVQDWYENTNGIPGALMEASVETANINISGGTFNSNFYAGGYAMAWNGKKSTSSVGTVNLNISGKDAAFNADIYLGGLEETRTDGVSVGQANVSIKDAKIGTLYGYSGHHSFNGTDHDYTVNKGKAVKTNLTMVNSEAASVEIGQGTVVLRAEDGGQTKITEALTVGSGVSVSLTTDGATNDKFKGDIKQAIQINGWKYDETDTNEIKMAEGLEMGEVTMVDGKLVEKTNSVQLATLDMASALPLAMGRILMNDVRKRLGDIRSTEGTHGIWARYDGGEMSGEGDFSNKFHTIQMGIDTVPTADSGRFGVAFSYTKGDSEFGRGQADMDAFSLAAYGTWIADNGMFADVIGRMATIDNDLTIDNRIGAKTDNVLLSLSGEIGWRFNMTETFYVEPQAELTYTYVNSDRFSLNDVEYDVDATDSLMARVGFAAGLKCPNNMGDVYVRVSGVHEFLGDSAVQAGTAKPVELNGEDTWVEFGVGAQFNVNKNTYVYADIERTESAKLEEDWRANVGVRFAF